MRFEPNVLIRRAAELFEAGRHSDALKLYYEMADGDPSFDAGYLAMRLGACYEALGDLHAARFWYGRARDENPEVRDYGEARRRLEGVSVDDLVG